MKTRLVSIAICSILFLAPLLAQPTALGLGTLGNDGEPTTLFRIDLGAGTIEEIGPTSGLGCRGLAFDLNGNLRTLCGSGIAGLSLATLNTETGAVDSSIPIEVEGDEGLEFIPLDIEFRADGALFVLGGETICCILPPPPVPMVVTVDAGTGQFIRKDALMSGEELFLAGVTGWAREPGGNLVGVSPNGMGSSVVTVGAVDPEGFDVAASGLETDGPFAKDIAALDDGRFFTVSQDSQAIDTTFGVFSAQGAFSTAFHAQARIFSLLAPESPSRDVWILPVVLASDADMQSSYRTSLTLANFSASTQSATLEVFFNDGSSLYPSQVICPNDGGPDFPAGPPPPPIELYDLVAHQQRRVLLSNSSFLGWGRVTAESGKPFVPQTEVSHVEGQYSPECSAAQDLPSTSILTTVDIDPVRPSREFSASGSITTTRESGFAVVNPSDSESAAVSITAFNADGSVFDTNQIVIEPGHRLARQLFDLLIEGKAFLLPPVKPTDFSGEIRFSSDIPIAVGALEVLLPEGRWSNIPVVSHPVE